MSVEDEVATNRQSIRSDGYAMSIGEMLNLYRDAEIVIRPEYQRLFRWPIEKKARLIESLLLDIPLPPIFVAQLEDSRWEVVDGLQRLSTILEFMGVLRDEVSGDIMPPSELTRTKYIPSLEGAYYNDLPTSVKLQLKRARLDFRILLRESDDAVKYELFDRLNSGGMRTSPQEVRTALLIMKNVDFFNSLNEFRQDQMFRDTLALTDRQFDEQYDLELLVRFIVFRASTAQELSAFSDIDTFMTDRLLALADDTTGLPQSLLAEARRVFEAASVVGPAIFRKYDEARGKSVGAFSVSAFEATTLGIAEHVGEWLALGADERSEALLARAATLWSDAEFKANSGAGVRATSRAPKMPQVGARIFTP